MYKCEVLAHLGVVCPRLVQHAARHFGHSLEELGRANDAVEVVPLGGGGRCGGRGRSRVGARVEIEM